MKKTKSRESIISEVENQMGYYDIPEAEPSISFTGKSVCELVDLAKILMAENDELDEAAHNKSLEVMKLQSALDTQKPAGDAGEAFKRLVTGKDYLRAGQASAGGDWPYNRKDDVETVKNALSGTKRGDCHSKTGIKYRDAIKELQEIIADCDAHGTAAKTPLPVRVRVLCDVVIESAALTGDCGGGDVRPYPELLSDAERADILKIAENLWKDLQENNLGGYSGINRPFHILHTFKTVIEKFGHRDVGLTWSKNMLDAALTADNAKRGE